MSVEENKAIVRRLWEEVINKGNMAVVDELVATNYIDHTQTPELVARDPESYKQVVIMFRTAFPDLHVTIEDKIAEGDKVVSRFTVRGTHKGEFMGIAPTGRQVTVTGIAIHRIAGGKLAEVWINMDFLGMMQQLGVVPTPR